MIIPYPLQDISSIEAGLAKAAAKMEDQYFWAKISAFVPLAGYVSLGASNVLESQVNLAACQLDGIGIFRRLSGGEAVFLSPQCVVFSQILVSGQVPRAADFFAYNLDSIKYELSETGIKGITRSGISDLAIANRKFLGCAIYRKVGFVLFQAVINVAEKAALIGRYLQHPPREPDYRAARSHTSFITSLQEQGFKGAPEEVANLLMRIKPYTTD